MRVGSSAAVSPTPAASAGSNEDRVRLLEAAAVRDRGRRRRRPGRRESPRAWPRAALHDGERGGAGAEEYVAGLIQEANRRVYERSSEDAAVSGMGTTMTVALAGDDEVVIGHVGDSLAYRVRDGVLEQLTDDHSLVAELVRSGKLSPEEAERHPQRSVITRALGSSPDVDVATFGSEALQDGDAVPCDLLRRAQLDMIGDETILAAVRARTRRRPAQGRRRRLLETRRTAPAARTTSPSSASTSPPASTRRRRCRRSRSPSPPRTRTRSRASRCRRKRWPRRRAPTSWTTGWSWTTHRPAPHRRGGAAPGRAGTRSCSSCAGWWSSPPSSRSPSAGSRARTSWASAPTATWRSTRGSRSTSRAASASTTRST